MVKQSLKNLQWLSPAMKNELLHLMCQQVDHSLEKRVKASGEFALILDEATDLAHRTQVALCLRLVFKDNIEERVICFDEASSTTGQALTDLSVDKMKNFDVKNKLKAGGVDGVLALLSNEKGLAR